MRFAAFYNVKDGLLSYIMQLADLQHVAKQMKIAIQTCRLDGSNASFQRPKHIVWTALKARIVHVSLLYFLFFTFSHSHLFTLTSPSIGLFMTFPTV